MKAKTICSWVICLFCLAFMPSCSQEETSELAPVVKDRSTLGGPTESASSDWAIVIFGEIDGKYGVIGRGGAHLDKNGVPIRAAISYSLPQGKSRVLVDKGRTYVRSAKSPYVWVDVSDPVGNIPGFAPPTVISSAQGDYSQVKSRTYGKETFKVFERLDGSFRSGNNTVVSLKNQYWTDKSGQVRRRIAVTKISIKGKAIALVTVADRVSKSAIPKWYHYDRLFAPDKAIPAAAVIRAIARRGRSKSGLRSGVGQSSVFSMNTRSSGRPMPQRQSHPLLNFFISDAGAQDVSKDISKRNPWGDAGKLVIDEFPPPGNIQEDNSSGDRGPGSEKVADKKGLFRAWSELWTDASMIYLAGQMIALQLPRLGLAYVLGYLPVLYSTPLFFAVAGLAIGVAAIYFVGEDLYNARIHGDPHIVTFDRHRYVFQATGEFVVVNSPQFQVQQRFEGAKGKNTSVRATAVRIGKHVIEFIYSGPSGKNKSLSVIVDGVSKKIDKKGINFKDGTYVARQGSSGKVLMVFSPDGSYIAIENLDRAQNVKMALSKEMRAKITGGVAGTPDGNKANDFTLRDGKVMTMAKARTIKGLYGRFASSWRVRPGERLFTQGKAADYLTAEYTDLPKSVTKLSDFSAAKIAKARQTCIKAGVNRDVALQDCTYDVLASGGDAGWAKMAASSATVSSSAPSAVTTSIKARMPKGASSGKWFWWTIVNQSTKTSLKRHEENPFTIDLRPGRYSVKVVGGIFEGEKIIDVQASGSKKFFVDLVNRKVPVLSSPETVSAGEAMVFKWKGALAKGAHIIVAAPNAYKGYFSAYNNHRASDGSPAKLVAPAKAGSFEILYIDDQTETVLARKPLKVTAAKVKFTAPSEVRVGARFEFSFNGPNAGGDFIFIAKPKMKPDFDGAGYKHHTRNGVKASLTAPTTPGVYDLRYYSYGNQTVLAKHKLIVR